MKSTGKELVRILETHRLTMRRPIVTVKRRSVHCHHDTTQSDTSWRWKLLLCNCARSEVDNVDGFYHTYWLYKGNGMCDVK